MASAISARPALPQQKMKRPPLPSVQTTVNGVKSTQPSLSPSLASKRPPAAFKQPPSATVGSGLNGAINGSVSRSSVRRKESQKPGDGSGRPSRSVRSGPGEVSKTVTKRMPEPYVRTTSYILKKFWKQPPSFTLHLHPTHFRFDQQDGSFSYNSPMKLLLEHIRLQTVPHDLLDELTQAGINFYDGCLIVQIQDYRSNSSVTQATTNTSNHDKNIPFSIHNYNEHLTPSPFVPYPHLNTSEANDTKPKEGALKAENDMVGVKSDDKSLSIDQLHASSSETPKGPKIFTTVLFPTPQSLHEEVIAFVSIPDNRSNNRKQSQVNSRTSVSGTNQPPTPMSAVPPTPTFAGLSAKRQKIAVNIKDIAAFEGKIIAAMAPPLFLDPVDSVEESQKILRLLQDPLFENKPPAPKTRKRTVAELAADEALAEEEQRFMLIMDERLVPTTNGGAGNTAADGESGAASFEPRFERFKALEEIKSNIEEKRKRDQEAKLMQQQIAKAKSEQQESQLQKLQQNAEERQKRLSQQDLPRVRPANLSMIQQQHYIPAGQIPVAHPPTSNTIQQLSVSQSSPVVRNLTPHNNNSSPVVGNVMLNHSANSLPMTVTTSSQGAGSPPRPGSALQHSHPGVNQRSQQPPSRNGTPQMQNGTPHLQQASPGMRNVTPTPRLRHASPAGSAVAPTPVLGHNIMATPHMSGQQLSQQQQNQIMQQRQAAFVMQGSPPNQNLQHIAAQQAHQRNQLQQQQQSQELYRQQLQSLTQQQMGNTGQNGNAHLGNNLAAMQAQQQAQHAIPLTQRLQQIYPQLVNQWTIRLTQQAQTQLGVNLSPQVMQRIKDQAMIRAKAQIKSQQQQQQQLHQQQQQHHQQQQHQRIMAQQQYIHQQQQQQQAMMNGGMIGQAMNGLGGMNGM